MKDKHIKTTTTNFGTTMDRLGKRGRMQHCVVLAFLLFLLWQSEKTSLPSHFRNKNQHRDRGSAGLSVPYWHTKSIDPENYHDNHSSATATASIPLPSTSHDGFDPVNHHPSTTTNVTTTATTAMTTNNNNASTTNTNTTLSFHSTAPTTTTNTTTSTTTATQFPFRFSNEVIEIREPPSNNNNNNNNDNDNNTEQQYHVTTLPYVCQGPLYQEFSQQLQAYAAHLIETHHRRPFTWGQRSLPPHTHILLWGNSHTRQLGTTLVGQHQKRKNRIDTTVGMQQQSTLSSSFNNNNHNADDEDQDDDEEDDDDEEEDDDVIGMEIYDDRIASMARRFDLTRNRSVTIVANSYVPYVKDWKGSLQQQLHRRKLSDFNAIILGTFNTCREEEEEQQQPQPPENNATTVHSKFYQEMKALMQDMHDPNMDCIRPRGVTFAKVAAHYPGPVVYVSMFSTMRNNTASQEQASIQTLQQGEPNHHNNNNISSSSTTLSSSSSSSSLFTDYDEYYAFINGRQYIEDNQSSFPQHQLMECGSSERYTVSDCVNTVKAAHEYHRCIGTHGGHADLIAWDLIEFLWHHTTSTSTSTTTTTTTPRGLTFRSSRQRTMMCDIYFIMFATPPIPHVSIPTTTTIIIITTTMIINPFYMVIFVKLNMVC